MDDTSDAESDVGSPSLPSLPTSLQQEMNQIEEKSKQKQFQTQQQQPFSSTMTIKEIDKKLAELRRENFNLKLRLYFVEKDKNGVSKPEYESAIAEEMAKREKAIRAYQRVVTEKEKEIDSLKALFDEQLKKKDEEISTLKNENNTLLSEIEINNSVCRSLMSHLNEIKEYWRNYLNNSRNNFQINELMTSFSNWLNTSEDLLNSASVLITENCANNSSRDEILNDSNVTGLGMSSLGIFSNLSEMIETKHAKKSYSKQKINTKEEDVQTDLTLLTLDAIIYDYQSLVNKEIKDSFTQTSITEQISEQTQTPSTVKIDQCVETIKHVIVSRSVQVKPINVNVSSQTLKVNESIDSEMQTDPIEANIQVQETNTNSTHTGHKALVIKRNTDIETQEQDQHLNTQFSNSNNIHTQSSNLSKTDTHNQNDHDTDHHNHHHHHHYSKSPLKQILHRSHESINIFEAVDSVDNTVRSYPSSPVKHLPSMDAKENLSNSECPIFKMPNDDYLYSKVKKATITKISSNSKVCKETLIDNCKEATNSVLLNGKYSFSRKSQSSSSSGSSMSSSSSSHDEFSRVKTLAKPARQPLNLGIAKITQSLKSAMIHDETSMSSPDLGIGESDPDQPGLLRAYLTINNYQLLRCNINELFSIINSVDHLSRDYCLKLIDFNEYFTEMKIFISNIFQIINSLRSICRNFNVEDTQALQMQLEKIRNRKENMEKVITRQLIKTDKLLKKARINLKDN